MTQLEQLLQKYEYENSQLTKAILTERDKIAIVERQKRENEKKISEFESIISNIEMEIGREIKSETEKEREIERLKNETYILKEHRDAKWDKLNQQKGRYEKMITNTEQIIQDSSKKLDTYMEKYETIPRANKFLNEKARAAEMKDKIKQASEMIITLSNKEIELRELSEQKNENVSTLDIQIKKLLIESADFRKSAVTKFKQFAANRIAERKFKQIQHTPRPNNLVHHTELKGRRLLLERNRLNVTPLRSFQSEKRFQKDNFSQHEYSHDPNDSCDTSKQIDDMDPLDNQTSTPKLMPILSPGPQLSPLTMFLGNSCSEMPFSSPEPSQQMKRRSSISVSTPITLPFSPIKAPNTLYANTCSPRHSSQMRTRKLGVDSPLLINRSSPFLRDNEMPVQIPPSGLSMHSSPRNHNPHYSANEARNVNPARRDDRQEYVGAVEFKEGGRKSLVAANEQKNKDQGFRFGFMEEPLNSSNPFGTDFPDSGVGNSRSSSDFPTSLFAPGSGMMTQTQETTDNPFSFVP